MLNRGTAPSAISNPKALVSGIATSGRKLPATAQPSTRRKLSHAGEKKTKLTFSIGLLLAEDGTIKDVLRASPAEEAGGVPGSKLIAADRHVGLPEGKLERKFEGWTSERELEPREEDALVSQRDRSGRCQA